MENKVIIGKLLITIGNELCDGNSELFKSIVLSNEQMIACLNMLKVASSPQTHIYYIGDLAMRYKVTDRTIRNWIAAGVIPKGKKHDSGDNRDYWLSHELYKVDERLVSLGYVKRHHIEKIETRFRRIIDNYM